MIEWPAMQAEQPIEFNGPRLVAIYETGDSYDDTQPSSARTSSTTKLRHCVLRIGHDAVIDRARPDLID